MQRKEKEKKYRNYSWTSGGSG